MDGTSGRRSVVQKTDGLADGRSSEKASQVQRQLLSFQGPETICSEPWE